MGEFPSFNDLFTIGKNEALLRNPKLSPAAIDNKGSDINIILGMAASIGEEIGRFDLGKFSALFFQTASGTDLDRLAVDRFNVPRKEAAAAVGSIRFSRPTTGAGNVFIATGTRVASSTITFKTTVDATLTGLTIDVPIAATTVGANTNVDAGTITNLIDSLTDPTVTVSNPLPTAGGADIETDSAYRLRLSNFILTLAKGTLSALTAAALAVPGVAVATAEDVLNPGAVPSGVARVFIADANGNSNQQLEDLVRAALDSVRAGGMQVSVAGAVVTFVQIALHVTFAAGADTILRSGQVKDAVLTSVNNLTPGQTLTLQRIRDAVATVPQVTLPLVGGILAPTGDLVPAANEVIRTKRESITFS